MKMCKSNYKYIYSCDFETTPYQQYLKEGRTRVYLYECINLTNTLSNKGICIEDFMNYVFSIQHESVFYFHNGSGFDFEFILWYLMENGYEYDEELSEHTFNTITTDMKKHYVIKIMNKGIKYEFRCSLLIMPLTIKKMGKCLGLEKLDETHDYSEDKNYNSVEEVTEEEWKYLHNDVEILRRALLYALTNGLTKLTISSSSFALWKQSNIYGFKSIEQIEDVNILERISKSYKGGITMVNPKFQNRILTDFISFDKNSLYPSVMNEFPMPVGLPRVYDTIDKCRNEGRNAYIVEVVVFRAYIRDGYIPFIPTGSTSLYNGYEYSDRIVNKTLYLWGKEFELFELYYRGEWKVETITGWRTRPNFFKVYLENLFKVKENAKDIFVRQIAKIKMNSTYGKFGMNTERIGYIPRLIDERIGYEQITTKGKYYPKEIASYITSCGRCKLVSEIEYNSNRFIYCDTDSIYLKGSEFPKFMDIDPKRIGAWGYEGHYKKGKFLKAKCYMKTFDDGTLDKKICGASQGVKEMINYDNFNYGLKIDGCKLISCKVTGGIVLKATGFTINLPKKKPRV